MAVIEINTYRHRGCITTSYKQTAVGKKKASITVVKCTCGMRLGFTTGHDARKARRRHVQFAVERGTYEVVIDPHRGP